MPVRQSLLSTLPGQVEPVEPALPPPVIEQQPGPVPGAPSAGGAPGTGPGPPPAPATLRKCDTAVTLQERGSGNWSGRLLRSLTPSRVSLAPAVSSVSVCPPPPPPLRHAVTLSSLEQARQHASCSRCGSRQALRLPAERRATCGVCLGDVPAAELHRLRACGCHFCRECMSTYVSVCVGNGEPTVACPERQCPAAGRLSADEIRHLTDPHTFRKYQRLAFIREVDQDPARTWCPRPGCDSACHLPAGAATFRCSACDLTYCAVCRRPRPAGDQHECRPERWLLGGSQLLGAAVKQCPHCGVPIEREDGCAQMMCRRCRHVFCWYCLTSLDGDLFLRHYDSGPCRHLLGHSRGSLVWHRVQLVGALIGVGLAFVVAAPVLILFAPVFMCSSCQCDPAQGHGAADAESSARLAPRDGSQTPPEP